MESAVKQRIKEYIKYKGLSVRQFCISIGASPAFVANIVKSIQPDKIDSIANQYPDLNTGWLLTGEGEMIRPAQNRFSQMTEKEIEEITTTVFTEELMKLYESGEIYSAKQFQELIAEKDKKIEALLRENWELKQKMAEK